MIVALKTIGYMVSIVSVILLGIAAWQSARGDDFLQLCLIGGMMASMLGMLLRWTSHLLDQREKDRIAKKAGPAADAAADPILLRSVS